VTSATGDTEGLPTVVFEALASGLPLVASDHAGIPEAVADGRTGYLVAEGDVAGLARRIIDLLDDGERWTRMAGAAREVAVVQFELGRQTRRLESIYDEVCA